MTLRSYAPRQGVLPPELPARDGRGNAGLVHQRFLGLPLVPTRGKDARGGSDAGLAIRSFITLFDACAADGEPLLQAWQARLDAAAWGAAASAPSHLDVTLASRLALGFGNVHPLQNGLTLHHTLGVPVIPGTTLKGLLRAWLELSGEGDSARWLGQGADDGEDAVGSLVIYDALPTRWPRLEQDIVNCHLPAWYRGVANRGAVPKESPVPAMLLVVAAGATFRLRVGARRPEDLPDAERALAHLRDALSMLGVGSKTAAGYGWFDLQDWIPAPPTERSRPMHERTLQAFLSHRSVDKDLVREVADALTRVGIIPWVDEDRLLLGDKLTDALSAAVHQSGAFVPLLGGAALESTWVRDEVRDAMRREEQDSEFPVLPVLWKVGAEHLRSDPLFKPWFADGRLDRVTSHQTDARALGREIAKAFYARRGLSQAPEWGIVCDQRGDGKRVGLPAAEIPGEAPVLVFRQDRQQRTERETLLGADWVAWRDEMAWALQSADPLGLAAAGGSRRASLHLRCQLAVALWLGTRLGYQRGWVVRTWDHLAKGWAPWEDGRAKVELITLQRVEGGDGEVVDLFVGHPDRRGEVPLGAVRAWRAAHAADGPLVVWSGPYFTAGEPLDGWATGVARALLEHTQGRRAVRLFTTSPVIALVSLGRMLTQHITPQLTLMEWVSTSDVRLAYQPCPIFGLG
jgi:CRISPR/Cas system CMR subunit Cmr6 (Cas7 group RAMP superfamily)